MKLGLERGEEFRASTFPASVGLELFREHTLLGMMTVRMRETASALDRGVAVDPERLGRLLEVHRRYLIQVHQANEARLDTALARRREPEVRRVLEECAREHPRAEEFQLDLSARLARGSRTPEARRGIAAAIRSEADRLEAHHDREEELYRTVDEFLTPHRAVALLAELRRFDAEHVNAEIALLGWASEIHPSAD
jgi:hemerythrin-like domain-containing protein